MGQLWILAFVFLAVSTVFSMNKAHLKRIFGVAVWLIAPCIASQLLF